MSLIFWGGDSFSSNIMCKIVHMANTGRSAPIRLEIKPNHEVSPLETKRPRKHDVQSTTYLTLAMKAQNSWKSMRPLLSSSSSSSNFLALASSQSSCTREIKKPSLEDTHKHVANPPENFCSSHRGPCYKGDSCTQLVARGRGLECLQCKFTLVGSVPKPPPLNLTSCAACSIG